MDISLVFVTKNEHAGLAEILPNMDLSQFSEVYAVDGNSSDGTVELFQSYDIPVFTQREKGLGAATFEARYCCNSDAMIFFHPDGNENFRDIPEIVKYLQLGYDLVIPSRMIKGAFHEDDVHWYRPRKWANRAFALLANLLFAARRGARVTDVVQGFRGITCHSFDRLRLDQKNCTIDYQMIIRALKCRLNIYEFPTVEGTRISGETSFASIPTGLAELKMLIRELFIRVPGYKKNTPVQKVAEISRR